MSISTSEIKLTIDEYGQGCILADYCLYFIFSLKLRESACLQPWGGNVVLKALCRKEAFRGSERHAERDIFDMCSDGQKGAKASLLPPTPLSISPLARCMNEGPMWSNLLPASC